MLTLSKPQLPTDTTAEQSLQKMVDNVLQQAIGNQKSGRIQSAEDLYLAILEAQPNHPDANHNLGILIALSQQPSAGLPHLQAALKAQPENEQYWLSYIDALIRDGQFDVAAETLELGRKHGLQGSGVEKLKERLLGSSLTAPQSRAGELLAKGDETNKAPAPSRQDLKKLERLRGKGRLVAIETFARDLIGRFPDHGLGWKALASTLHKQGQLDDALSAMLRTVELLPEDSGAHCDLGLMLNAKARFDEAEIHYRKALELKPDMAIAMSNLGCQLREQRRLGESEDMCRRALALKQTEAAYNALGATLIETGQIVAAEDCFRKALKINPNYALSYVNLGVSLRKQGRLDEAIKYQRRALKLGPQDAEHFSNLLFTLNYSDSSASFLLEEARRFGRMVEKKIKKPFSVWKCSAEPKKLRVGLVSGDLYSHPVGFFLEGVLANLDPARVEVIAYSSDPKVDHLTARLKPHLLAWKTVYTQSDQAAAQMIHEDGIHVLLDLAGHTTHNRLPMMAWKPAPVQASWLGYFATTGVTGIDYILADEVGVPAPLRGNFTESIWYLPETRLCFSVPPFDVPVAPLPALDNGYITFGCFQLLTKVSDATLKRWSTILEELPEARLRWQCGQFNDAEVVAQAVARLTQNGIDSTRVDTHGSMPRADYLKAHAEVDLILDTSPFPGGTTTCEALWMGVPTLTLAGESLLGRQGASLLTAAGLQDWIATNPADYIKKAVTLATNWDGLATLRDGLRAQSLASPLFDSKRFARNFEDALWGMWQARQPKDGQLVATEEEVASGADPIMNFFNPVHWGTKDPAQFNDLMRKAADQTTAYHYGDNMFVFQRNNSMLSDLPFVKSWEENALTDPDRTIIWRRYILAMAAFHCQNLEGDFVECGAYQGVGAKTVIDYLGGPKFKKTFWLYDMFEHNEKMVNHSMQAHGPKLHAQVVKRFAGYPNVKIFKGFLPEVLAEGCPEKIAYLHLDLNQAPAEIATLNALFERVVPGGMIILDDYEMVFYRAQKLAEDTWFAKRGYKVFPLPTSQGFVIKR